MAAGQVPVKEYDTMNTKHSWDYAKIRAAHRGLAQHSYAKGTVEKGYANRTLYVNLTTREIREKRSPR
jgi:hypothetical protein